MSSVMLHAQAGTFYFSLLGQDANFMTGTGGGSEAFLRRRRSF